LNDITDTVGSVFLGLTYGCARCHDHKFDPISQRDYYRLQAFFANVRTDDRAMLVPAPARRAYEEQYSAWEDKTREPRLKMDKLVEPIRQTMLKQALARFPEDIREICLMPAEQRNPYQRLMYLMAKPQLDFDDSQLGKRLKGEEAREFASLSELLKKYQPFKPADPPMAQTIVDYAREAPPTHVLAVGVWNAPKEEVQPAFLSILNAGSPKINPPQGLNSSGRRTALANWLADGNNPLTARVMVNRIWYYHFGRGIVASPSDFGVMGDRPANQPLLDYLAAYFTENEWSVKKLHRLIMLSDAYQESSAYQAAGAAADPDNLLLWRYNRRRLEGEVIRDSMLLVAGKLNLKAGGPGIHPPLPEGTTPPRFGTWNIEKDDEINRRSVYVFVKRNLIYPMFQAFDAPNAQEPCARRFRTVIPTQALTLMNEDLVHQWVQAMAARVLDDQGLSQDQQIERAYRLALSRGPNAEERQAVRDFINQQGATDAARAQGFTQFCHVLWLSNEFLYVN
jgi:hypothetical protein